MGSLRRLEAPKQYLPVDRDGSVNTLAFSVGGFGIIRIAANLSGLVLQGVTQGANSILANFFPRDAVTGQLTNGGGCIRNLTTCDGFRSTTFSSTTLTAPNLAMGGVFQFGSFADEGGATITVTLPTQAEIAANIPSGPGVAWGVIRVVQAATNVADQINFATSDLVVRFNGGGQTGTGMYHVMFDRTAAGVVSVSIIPTGF